MSHAAYEKPREKLQKQGAQSLTSTELLQLIIGSGNAKVSAVKTARKTLRQLQRYGSDVHYETLLGVKGLGVAKCSEIIAAFELASRFPVIRLGSSVKHDEGIIREMMRYSHVAGPSITYFVVDAAYRILDQGVMLYKDSSDKNSFYKTLVISVAKHSAHTLVLVFSLYNTPELALQTIKIAKEVRLLMGVCTSVAPVFYTCEGSKIQRVFEE